MFSNNLKKLVLVLLLCLVSTLSIFAENKNEPKWRGSIIFDPVNVSLTGYGVGFDVGFSAYYRAQQDVQIGAGFLINEGWKFKSRPDFPIFVGIKYDKLNESFSPTASFETGVSLSSTEIKYSSFFINPMVGIRFGNVGAGIGYWGGIPVGLEGGKWASYINLRLSYNFWMGKNTGASQTANKISRAFEPVWNFFKPINVILDLGTDIPVKPNSEQEFTSSDLTGFGLDVSFLYPLGKGFELGPTIGAHINSKFSYIPIAVRTRYNFNQIGLNSPLYPWIQFDLGGYAGIDAAEGNFYWRPAIGLSYDVRGGKSALELSLGFNMIRYSSYVTIYNMEYYWNGIFGINLGYRF